jgi:hypothetical protein
MSSKGWSSSAGAGAAFFWRSRLEFLSNTNAIVDSASAWCQCFRKHRDDDKETQGDVFWDSLVLCFDHRWEQDVDAPEEEGATHVYENEHLWYEHFRLKRVLEKRRKRSPRLLPSSYAHT